MIHSPTAEQIDAVNLAIENKSMKLMAFAGAGKTTVLQMIANALKAHGKNGLYLAFNKAIAVEAKSKMPDNIQCSSFHSLAYRNSPRWMTGKIGKEPLNGVAYAEYHRLVDLDIYANAKVKGSLNKRRVQRKFTIWQQKKVIDVGLDIFMRTSSKGPAFRHLRSAINEHFNEIEEKYKEMLVGRLFNTMEMIWSDYVSPEGVLGYGNKHDIYLKAWALSKPKLDTDFILFDEAQDANPIFIGILLEQECPVIYVGDANQQIYEWRGALNIMQRLDVPARYLTKSFRFSQELANYCQPIIEYLKETKKIKGRNDFVTLIDEKTFTPKDVDVVLTRTNIGAIEVMIDYAAIGKYVIPVNINLNQSIKMLDSLEEFKHDPNSQWRHPILKNFQSFTELKRYNEEYFGDQSIAPYMKLYDKYEYHEIKKILKKCLDCERDGGWDFRVTTAHKSKGCEWDRVLIHYDFKDQFFNEDGTYKDAPDEEYRLLYVALTRAKKELYTLRIKQIMDIFKKINK